MTTASEKLIKQVSYRIASIWNERLPTWPTVGERDRIRDEVAGDIVDLVLSAVRDGLPFPDEVGRGRMDARAERDGVLAKLHHCVFQGSHFGGTYPFIAFRIEGTGKEER